MAKKFGLPDYAMTSLAQVRYLRMQLAIQLPQFMGRGMSRPDAKIGDSINSSMSPLQAVHVVADLADQKLSNPDYQIPPEEWDPKKSVWPRESKPGVAGAVLIDAPKTGEMIRVLSQGISALSPQDAAQLVDGSFGTLGLK
jgi:hypothetical protein